MNNLQHLLAHHQHFLKTLFLCLLLSLCSTSWLIADTFSAPVTDEDATEQTDSSEIESQDLKTAWECLTLTEQRIIEAVGTAAVIATCHYGGKALRGDDTSPYGEDVTPYDEKGKSSNTIRHPLLNSSTLSQSQQDLQKLQQATVAAAGDRRLNNTTPGEVPSSPVLTRYMARQKEKNKSGNNAWFPNLHGSSTTAVTRSPSSRFSSSTNLLCLQSPRPQRNRQQHCSSSSNASGNLGSSRRISERTFYDSFWSWFFGGEQVQR